MSSVKNTSPLQHLQKAGLAGKPQIRQPVSPPIPKTGTKQVSVESPNKAKFPSPPGLSLSSQYRFVGLLLSAPRLLCDTRHIFPLQPLWSVHAWQTGKVWARWSIQRALGSGKAIPGHEHSIVCGLKAACPISWSCRGCQSLRQDFWARGRHQGLEQCPGAGTC